ncbi:unnamed protein product [Arctogadus glacialis]
MLAVPRSRQVQERPELDKPDRTGNRKMATRWNERRARKDKGTRGRHNANKTEGRKRGGESRGQEDEGTRRRACGGRVFGGAAGSSQTPLGAVGNVLPVFG